MPVAAADGAGTGTGAGAGAPDAMPVCVSGTTGASGTMEGTCSGFVSGASLGFPASRAFQTMAAHARTNAIKRT